MGTINDSSAKLDGCMTFFPLSSKSFLRFTVIVVAPPSKPFFANRAGVGLGLGSKTHTGPKFKLFTATPILLMSASLLELSRLNAVYIEQLLQVHVWVRCY